MFQVDHLTIQYTNRVLIQDLSFSLKSGEILTILGKNGVGKTSLLKSIYSKKYQKHFLYKKRNLDRYSIQDLSKTVAYLIPNSVPVFDMTVKDYLALGRLPYQKAEVFNKNLEEYIKLLALGSYQEKSILTLSSGEFQKVQICRCLNQETPIIILDEPTSFLDFPSKIEFFKNLQNICKQKGKIVIMTSHDIDLAWKFSHRTLLLDGKGKSEFVDSKELETGHLLNLFFANDHFDFQSGGKMKML
jgi:iron complex transport system ATP-binding protein